MLRALSLVALAALATLPVQSQATATGRVGATILRASQTQSLEAFHADRPADAAQGAVESQATVLLKGSPREAISLVLPTRVELRTADGRVATAEGFGASFMAGSLDRQGERKVVLGTQVQLPKDGAPGVFRGHADILVAYN